MSCGNDGHFVSASMSLNRAKAIWMHWYKVLKWVSNCIYSKNIPVICLYHYFVEINQSIFSIVSTGYQAAIVSEIILFGLYFSTEWQRLNYLPVRNQCSLWPCLSYGSTQPRSAQVVGNWPHLWTPVLACMCRKKHSIRQILYAWKYGISLIARFMGPTWGPSGADRTQVGPMLAAWTGMVSYVDMVV